MPTTIRDAAGNLVTVATTDDLIEMVATEAGQQAIAAALGDTLIVAPQLASGGNLQVQTNSTGANAVPFGDQACKQLTIINDTGTTIVARQGGAGVAIPIFDQSSFSFFGLSNANQIDVRRKDSSNTPVTVQARWEA